MTNTSESATPQPSADGGPPDPRPALSSALDTLAGVLDALSADDLSRPTPCSEYDVADLTGHVVAVAQRIAAVGRAEDPLSVPQVVEGLDATSASPAFAAARAEIDAVWSDDGHLVREVVVPFGNMPGFVALGVYVGELSIHTWDLARSIGAEVVYDEAILAPALEGLRQGLPAEPRGGATGVPFDPVVATAEDAPLIDKMVAWVGRDPSWSGA